MRKGSDDVCSFPSSELAELPEDFQDTPAARSAEDDLRIAIHEAGHVIVGRALGSEFGGVTIVAGPDYGGLTWGPKSEPTPDKMMLSADDREVGDLATMVGHLMPGPGESRQEVPEIYSHVHRHVVELMAGTAAETVLHTDDPPLHAASDERRARSLASLICSSERSIDAYLAAGLEEAIAIVARHRYAVQAIAQALIHHPDRTLDAAEIDAVIAEAVSREALGVEHERRAGWRQTAANAAHFTPDAA